LNGELNKAKLWVSADGDQSYEWGTRVRKHSHQSLPIFALEGAPLALLAKNPPELNSDDVWFVTSPSIYRRIKRSVSLRGAEAGSHYARWNSFYENLEHEDLVARFYSGSGQKIEVFKALHIALPQHLKSKKRYR
ncbi:MAG: hypothetical protein AAGI44_19850, partial [Pseudomonadota bacterium]